MASRATWAAAAAVSTLLSTGASAQSVQELQRQIDELKAQVRALTEARGIPPEQAAAPATPPAASPAPVAPQLAAAPADAAPPAPVAVATPPAQPDAWYDRLRLRGYTQLRYNTVLSGAEDNGPGMSRLRSVHDSSINDDGGFLLRRVRLVLQGDVSDHLSLYLQHDFGTAVNNQSSTERRENFGQLRDAYVDVFPSDDRRFKLRVGQSKVPFGWENLQSSSNRIPLDRSDGINSGVPGERDLGVVAYFTPTRVQEIWDRLEEDGQKLFGNYGAFGLALYNGQGINRTERNGSLMKVAMATWPFALDGLGGAFRGQVLELGGSVLFNQVRPETRAGGVTPIDYDERRFGLHAILYPRPFGIQAEWTRGRGPQFDTGLQTIRDRALGGGYVQLMANLGQTPIGRLIPYGRWQRYRGGWKASIDAPRLETDEFELGVEWALIDQLELTLAYANMNRREADARRTGRAEGDLIRTQLQWSY